MLNTNIVIIAGNLGADPVLRRTDSGGAVLNLSIANDQHRRVGEVFETKTSWHDITVWGAAAEHHAKHLTRGSEILVHGKLNTRSYEDRQGITRRHTEIVAERIEWVKLMPRQEATLVSELDSVSP